MCNALKARTTTDHVCSEYVRRSRECLQMISVDKYSALSLNRLCLQHFEELTLLSGLDKTQCIHL